MIITRIERFMEKYVPHILWIPAIICALTIGAFLWLLLPPRLGEKLFGKTTNKITAPPSRRMPGDA